MFFCVYIGNSKISNTARNVHWAVKQESRIQEEWFALAFYNCCLSVDRKQWQSQSNSQIHKRPLKIYTNGW